MEILKYKNITFRKLTCINFEKSQVRFRAKLSLRKIKAISGLSQVWNDSKNQVKLILKIKRIRVKLENSSQLSQVGKTKKSSQLDSTTRP